MHGDPKCDQRTICTPRRAPQCQTRTWCGSLCARTSGFRERKWKESVTSFDKSRADGERPRHKSAISSARRLTHCDTKRRIWTAAIAWVSLLFAFVGSALGQANLLQNGDFESGGAAWTFSGDFYYAYDYNFPNNGFGYAYLGKTAAGNDYLHNAAGVLYQTVTVPTNANSITLSFFLWIAAENLTPDQDRLDVELRDTSGGLLQSLGAFSKANWGGYSQQTFPISSAYAGRSFRLVFRGSTDSANGTIFRIDDARLVFSSSPELGQFQLTTTPECSGTHHQIRLDWTSATEAAHYDVYRSDVGVIAYDLPANANQYIDADTFLTPGRQYTYHVRARNNVGAIDSTSASAVVPDCTAPNHPPESFALGLIRETSPTTAYISWFPAYDQDVGDHVHYEVWMGLYPNPTVWQKKASVDAPTREATVTGLIPNTFYDVRVIARDDHGGSVTNSELGNFYELYTPPNHAPSISITSPQTGSRFGIPASIVIEVNASDSDGFVRKVEFFADGRKIGEVNSPSLPFTWYNAPAHSYSLTALAHRF
jgi:Bacterial Ig domain/Fibronectin type III domain